MSAIWPRLEESRRRLAIAKLQHQERGAVVQVCAVIPQWEMTARSARAGGHLASSRLSPAKAELEKETLAIAVDRNVEVGTALHPL